MLTYVESDPWYCACIVRHKKPQKLVRVHTTYSTSVLRLRRWLPYQSCLPGLFPPTFSFLGLLFPFLLFFVALIGPRRLLGYEMLAATARCTQLKPVGVVGPFGLQRLIEPRLLYCVPYCVLVARPTHDKRNRKTFMGMR
jgi:hypothetical protein